MQLSFFDEHGLISGPARGHRGRARQCRGRPGPGASSGRSRARSGPKGPGPHRAGVRGLRLLDGMAENQSVPLTLTARDRRDTVSHITRQIRDISGVTRYIATISETEMATGLTIGESNIVPIIANNGKNWPQRGSSGGVEGTARAADFGRVVVGQRLRGRRGNGVRPRRFGLRFMFPRIVVGTGSDDDPVTISASPLVSSIDSAGANGHGRASPWSLRNRPSHPACPGFRRAGETPKPANAERWSPRR